MDGGRCHGSRRFHHSAYERMVRTPTHQVPPLAAEQLRVSDGRGGVHLSQQGAAAVVRPQRLAEIHVIVQLRRGGRGAALA